MNISAMSTNQAAAYALSLWINYIETGDLLLSDVDLANRGLPPKRLTEDQQKAVARLREIRQSFEEGKTFTVQTHNLLATSVIADNAAVRTVHMVTEHRGYQSAKIHAITEDLAQARDIFRTHVITTAELYSVDYTVDELQKILDQEYLNAGGSTLYLLRDVILPH